MASSGRWAAIRRGLRSVAVLIPKFRPTLGSDQAGHRGLVEDIGEAGRDSSARGEAAGHGGRRFLGMPQRSGHA